MSFKVLAKIIKDSLDDQKVRMVDFVWHGGEVTLLQPSYLIKALRLQEHYRSPNTEIFNSIQTNATILTSEWIEFLKTYKISVGISIDGPPEVHDSRRKNKYGLGTWKDVKAGIDRLREANIPFGGLAVVDEQVIEYGAVAFLDYLTALNLKSVALLNVLPQMICTLLILQHT